MQTRGSPGTHWDSRTSASRKVHSRDQNEEHAQKENIRRAIAHDMADARKRGDQSALERLEGQLETLEARGELPISPSTRVYRNTIRDQEDVVLVAFERAEQGFVESDEPERSDRLRAIREAFVDRLDDTEDGRFLRSQGLSRRGRYAVLLDAEAIAQGMFVETNRTYQFASEIYQTALAILQHDAIMRECHDAWINAAFEIRNHERRVRNGYYTKAQAKALEPELNQWKALRDDLQKQWTGLYSHMATPKQREEVQDQLMRRLGLLKDRIDELAPVMTRVQEEYKTVQDPLVQRAMERSELKLGPSERFRDNRNTLIRTIKELRSMKIDLHLKVKYSKTLSL